MTEIRMLFICYRLLSKMDRNAQQAALGWLSSRLAADHKKSKEGLREVKKLDQRIFSKAVGDVALNLLSFVKVTGGKAGKRAMEVRGPINADVVVHVKPVN